MIWRISAALAAVVVLALLIHDVPLAGFLREVEEARLTASLERDAFLLAGRVQQELVSTSDSDRAVMARIATEYEETGAPRLVIVDAQGLAVAANDGTDIGVAFSSRPEFASALAGRPASGERRSETLGGELLYAAVPVLAGTRTVGAVRVTYDDRAVSAAVSSKLGTLALVGTTTALVAALIGLVIATSMTRRLRLLQVATERFSAGDRHVRADERSGARELKGLALSFNGMAERIEGLIAQQRAFAGDASHQLRTPLTALRLRLERARTLTETDPVAAAERIEAAERELERLDGLIEGLLVLSRAEAAAATTTVRLGELAAERASMWSALADETGSRVVLEPSGPAPIVAASSAAEQILDNLVDNALKAGGPGTTVTIAVHVEADRTELTVSDDGPGLSEGDRRRAFDRFWRGRADSSGSGLGLAIVEQLSKASGATASLEESPSGGLRAVVRFLSASDLPAMTPGESSTRTAGVP